MIKIIYTKEKVGIVNTVTAYTSLIDLLRSEGMEHAYNSVRKIVLKGEMAEIKQMIIRKVELKHYKHGKQ